MFLWRNILSAVYWVCCCTHLFAQEIDYSKCSCDSLFKTVLKGNYLKSYSDNYQGKRRYIIDNKCITATDIDSTIVRYESKILFITENDTAETLKLITIKTDSILFHKKRNNHFSEIELYKRKVSDSEIEYNFFKKDFGLELRLKIIKSRKGNDSAFHYYSEKLIAPVYESNSRRIAFVYALKLPIKHLFSIDTNGYLNGKYIAYCPMGEKMTVQTFSHGIRNGYFYFANACKMCEDSNGEKHVSGKYYGIYYNNESNGFEYEKGYYSNGKRKGKWITKQEKLIGYFFVESGNFKKYILKYRKDKTYFRKFFIYKQIDSAYLLDLYSDSNLYDIIKDVNLIYRVCISDSTDYKSEFQRHHGPYHDVIKIK